jgi:hypothetical protein
LWALPLLVPPPLAPARGEAARPPGARLGRSPLPSAAAEAFAVLLAAAALSKQTRQGRALAPLPNEWNERRKENKQPGFACERSQPGRRQTAGTEEEDVIRLERFGSKKKMTAATNARPAAG